ncbi:protein FAM177A1 [Octopus bimaculoides]|uniref:Protein FAM177A1 n=1 Tax=Octopus bimaculoides TaxID=37653 RepID=A0A0L8G7Q8_OCTBM|nr:protein FAM177A1 [Octopus bimaculoides]|eukprot:XP_014783400.1 PREDICTED: protein FAM177A1-like [Octopus bimaculoides]
MAETRISQVNLVECIPKDVELSFIDLGDGNTQTKKKIPKRILHFSDGVIEEYSSSEDEQTSCDDSKSPLVPPKSFDPRSPTILPWIWFYLTVAFRKSLKTAEMCGEKLGWALGITSPKYQYAIDEYNRRKKEEEAAIIKRQQEGQQGKF